MKDRIMELLNTEGLSASKFADIIGVQRSSMSHILSGRNNPSLDFIQKIMRSFPDVSGDWLLSGGGEMTKNQASAPLFQETINDETPGSYSANQPPRLKKEAPTSTLNKPDQSPNLDMSAFVSGKKIEKVVVFYTDKTFKEYNPS
ncbi:helix-turn-helix transcriptional regulator [Ancylomarina sp. 16SWW S1-10-2]|uniref:helix-turn-helix transcriptional regulator n=1 Tax=Ancylomarina sp. 16SWW S1-10-2 TaxID=2499681 RepID=UPI0012AEA6C9|nr:helix-turn-helix transcriptional regulator [Ancylomarina sp. 16SWW S1-10-2]MRT92731.1 XRE family transcriptional regulator [Ancylomarina sp. 16SWW S1-10-2]